MDRWINGKSGHYQKNVPEKNKADKSVRLTILNCRRLFFREAYREVDEFAGRNGHVLWQADENRQTHLDTI